MPREVFVPSRTEPNGYSQAVRVGNLVFQVPATRDLAGLRRKRPILGGPRPTRHDHTPGEIRSAAKRLWLAIGALSTTRVSLRGLEVFSAGELLSPSPTR